MLQKDSPVAVITGASAGIGLAAAKALCARGWRVIGVGRDPERIAAAEQALRAIEGAPPAVLLQADLSVLSQVRTLAQRISELTDRVDLLANNAGGMARERVVTVEGLEANFAANHLGPFVLTQALLPLLRHAARGRQPGSVRIVNTSSVGSEMCQGLHWDDLQRLADWEPSESYLRCKLANVLHARALAERLAPDGIHAFSFHPGDVSTNFGAHVPDAVLSYMATLDMVSAEDGADTLVWLATAPSETLVSGQYYYRRALREPNPLANDPETVRRFWTASEQLSQSAP